MSSDPARVIADLRELDRLTGGPGGAQRVAWTDGWRRARQWLEQRLAEIPAATRVDAGGNLWAEIRGAQPGFVAVGSHIDSVPCGGWLDGALGVVAALEALRSRADTTPPLGLRLVDWADEEGARFGVSLFGSSAAAGRLERDLVGDDMAAALTAAGVELARVGEAERSLDGARGYLELHIEQGPILERAGAAVAVVTGTVGVERHRVRFAGTAAHAGAQPMDARSDPAMAAARLALAARDAARRRAGATATIGSISIEPGVPTIVPSAAGLILDLRAADGNELEAMLDGARRASHEIAGEEGVSVEWLPHWHIAPTHFDPRLVEAGVEAARAAGADPLVMASGALHDAASVAGLVPTVMLFVQSKGGISHNPREDTDEADLALAVRAYDELVERSLALLS